MDRQTDDSDFLLNVGFSIKDKIKIFSALAIHLLVFTAFLHRTVDCLLNPFPKQQFSNHGLETVTMHGRSVQLRMCPRVEAVMVRISFVILFLAFLK